MEKKWHMGLHFVADVVKEAFCHLYEPQVAQKISCKILD